MVKVSRTALLSAVSKLMSGTEQSAFIEGADTIYFSGEGIHSYNDSITISTVFKSDLFGSIKVNLFYKTLQKLQTEELEIEMLENQWAIKAGSVECTFDLQTDKVSEYIKGLSEIITGVFKKLPENFMDGLKLCRISGNASYLRGISCREDMMVSTDEIRLNYFKLSEAMEQFWIDDSGVNELIKIGEKMTEYSIIPGWIQFRGENGTIFSCKRQDDSQYKFDKILEYGSKYQKAETDSVQILPKGFVNILERVGIFYTDLNGYQAVSVHLTTEKLDLSSKTDSGSIKESIVFDSAFTQPIDASFKADFNFLREVANKCPQFFIRTAPNGVVDVVFDNGTFKQIMRTIAEKK